MVCNDSKDAQLKGSNDLAYHMGVVDAAEDYATNEAHIDAQWWELEPSSVGCGAWHLKNWANGQYLMVHPTDRKCILTHHLHEPYRQHKSWYFVFQR